MLTIGQLAATAGVTVRAVRHYHQCGLLAEPPRDASGYRRYDAQAVVDLVRIKTLAEAGVPLARIQELQGASPAEFARAITEIDDGLRRRLGELTRHRRRIAELAGGERLFLPAEIVDILTELRAMGVSERTVRTERDAWILMVAVSPEQIPGWVREKRAALDDPDFRRIYLACDEAFDWDPDDPRLADLARQMAAWADRSRDAGQRPDGWGSVSAPVVEVINSAITVASPAWRRLSEISVQPGDPDAAGPAGGGSAAGPAGDGLAAGSATGAGAEDRPADLGQPLAGVRRVE